MEKTGNIRCAWSTNDIADIPDLQAKLVALGTKNCCGIKRTPSGVQATTSAPNLPTGRNGQKSGYDDPDGPVVDTSSD